MEFKASLVGMHLFLPFLILSPKIEYPGMLTAEGTWGRH